MQEEKDEVTAKAMASSDSAAAAPPCPPQIQTQNPNPNPNPNPNHKVREEGELTSSDDDVLPAHSDTPSASLSAPPSSTVPNTAVKAYVQQGRSSGNSISGNPVRAADKHPQTAGYSKAFNRNKTLIKSSNPGWHAPAGNANLVISFSDDDDSGSDEERKRKADQVTNRHLQLANSSQRPPALPHAKPANARRTAKSEGKVTTKKLALSHTFISSVKKIHGSSVKSTVPLTEKRSWSNKPNVTGRNLPTQDGGLSKHADLSSSKLQDLRQQIAMRENELKLKIVQKNKENVSESCRDVDVLGQNKVSLKNSRTVPADTETDAEEPDAKRLKLNEISHVLHSSKGQQDNSFVSASQDRNISGHAHHVTKVAQKELLARSIEMQMQDGKQLPPLSENTQSRLMQDASAVDANCSLSDWVSGPMEASAVPKPTALLTNGTFTDHMDKLHSDLLNRNKLSSYIPNHEMCVDDMNKVNYHYAAASAHEKLKSKCGSTFQPGSLQVSDTRFESVNASPDNVNVLHSLGRPTVSGYDVDSLFEVEELHDKELEEAQEHRRRCEVEERNALKAYRRAQRALAEANARCTYLYRRRELYSAQLRSLLVGDSSSSLPSRQNRQSGDTWNLSYNVCEANLDFLPTSSHQLQAECETGNQVGYGSNAQSADGDAHNRLFGNEDGNNLGSEACSEPDASTSELLVRGNSSAATGVHSPSNYPNLSADDDGETFPSDHRSVHDTVSWPREEGNANESGKELKLDSARSFAAGNSQNPLLLEAYLRSKLFSRLGVLESSKRTDINCDSKSAAARVAEENGADGQTQMLDSNIPVADTKCISSHYGGLIEPHKETQSSISEPTLSTENQHPVEEHSLNNSPAFAFDSEDTVFHAKDTASASVTLPSSIYRSAMMAACSSRFDNEQVREHHGSAPGICNDNDFLGVQNEDKFRLEKASCHDDVLHPVSFGKIDSYTFSSAIDPFRPLCIYELRGRCNNDECPWQHLREHSSRNVDTRESSDGGDRQPGSSSKCQKQRACIESFGALTPPKYIVYFDALKAESHTHGSLLARHIGASQRNIFSNSLAVSNSLVKQPPSDEPYLHGNDGCVDSYIGSGHSLYFQSRNGAGNPLRNGLADSDQALELAILVLNQEVNRLDGMRKALSILSRALEADPASFQLWIVYLLLYHSTKNSVGELTKKNPCVEDDFFSHAVKHNTESYELWLLYINSRRQLNDRLAAYERALSCLCRHDTNNEHAVHSSAVILDLFLQMLYCFCVSGNIAKAVQRIQGLILADRDSDESLSLLLSDILQCLTISDKCVFWVSCVYLLIYRKLPDGLVRQFEFEKDISVIDWPSVRLTLEEKQQVLKLMEMAIDSIGFNIDSESSVSNLESAYLIALNHVKLTAAIDGEESWRMLLEKYRNSYPSCLQLLLLSARTYENDESKKFEGFAKALSSWPKDLQGIQCIWNQFAEYALENGRPDRAKEIMDEWFHSVWKPLSHNRSVELENDDGTTTSLDPLSGSKLHALPSNANKMDIVFGLLNLSLFKVFQNDVLATHSAIEKALKTADTENLRHCVREHAAFMLRHRSQLNNDTSLRGLVDILKGYMIHAQSILGPSQLTAKFIRDMKKPRLRQLVSSLLCPSSPDPSLVNSVLEVWFSPSLLPENTDELKELVDLVEYILELSPGNYQVAICACKLICKSPDGSKFRSSSVLFWASSVLVNTIYHAIPVPPEFVWIEAANLLQKLTDKEEIYESFHQRALSVHPFSIKLWKSFLSISTAPSKRNEVVGAAREKGIELDCHPTSNSS